MRAGEVAASAGVGLETLRYYERRGLLDRPERTLGGQRVYPDEAVTKLRIVKTAQRLGFTLSEIAELMDAARHRHADRGDSHLQRRVKAKVAEIDLRIAELQSIRASLLAAITAGCDDLSVCAGTPECPLPFGDLVSR